MLSQTIFTPRLSSLKTVLNKSSQDQAEIDPAEIKPLTDISKTALKKRLALSLYQALQSFPKSAPARFLAQSIHYFQDLKIYFELLNQEGETAGADDLLPLLVECLKETLDTKDTEACQWWMKAEGFYQWSLECKLNEVDADLGYYLTQLSFAVTIYFQENIPCVSGCHII